MTRHHKGLSHAKMAILEYLATVRRATIAHCTNEKECTKVGTYGADRLRNKYKHFIELLESGHIKECPQNLDKGGYSRTQYFQLSPEKCRELEAGNPILKSPFHFRPG
jgi:hypothetical protein